MRKLACCLGLVATAAAGCGSSGSSDKSISCYVAPQFICYEDANPTSAQQQNLPVKCSSDSGAFHAPAACPQNGYLGKCTFNAPDGVEVDRFYTGADPAYQQSFCETVDLGTWSTAF